MLVSEYTDTTTSSSDQYYVSNKDCYWRLENRTRMISTQVFGQGRVYYYTVVLKDSGDYIFTQDANHYISGGVVDPGVQKTIINAGKEIQFTCACKIVAGIGQVQNVAGIKLS